MAAAAKRAEGQPETPAEGQPETVEPERLPMVFVQIEQQTCDQPGMFAARSMVGMATSARRIVRLQAGDAAAEFASGDAGEES